MGAVKSRRRNNGSHSAHHAAAERRRKVHIPAVHGVGGDAFHQPQMQPFLASKSKTKNGQDMLLASPEGGEPTQPSGCFPVYADTRTSHPAEAVVPLHGKSVLGSGDRLFGNLKDSDLDVALYRHLNLDTHPAVTRLQNEQNLRLEGMEQRMNKIRKSAQQEAERRKFAHLFRARTEDTVQTEKLLKEASVALQLFKQEKQKRKSSEQKCPLFCDDSSPAGAKMRASQLTEEDQGDIIPVHIVSDKSSSAGESKEVSSKDQQPLMGILQPVERFNLSKFLSCSLIIFFFLSFSFLFFFFFITQWLICGIIVCRI